MQSRLNFSRADIERAIEIMIDVLDTLDGDPDDEPDADSEPGNDTEHEPERE